MGDSTPDAIELECPGCSARFRLRPTKGRLPKGPINCPECATPFDIPHEYREGEAPQAQVLRNKSEPSTGATEHELGDDNTAEVHVSKTMMGHPVAVTFDDPRAGEKTRAAPIKTLNEAIDESSEAIPESDDSVPEEQLNARETAEHEAPNAPRSDQSNLGETSESVFNNTTKAPWDNDSSPQLSEQNERSGEQKGTSNKQTRPNLKPNKSAQKPKLSELLKKVREKKADGGMLLGPPPARKSSPGDGLDNLLDETAEALKLTEDSSPEDEEPQTISPEPTPEMKDLRDALSPGMASETRGSGYIRIPTAEIMDVLGKGKYRLRVDDVVYEPVDEKGLARLIKGGVLMGAEEIAEEDGDWMPVAEHPVVKNLRRKMADQAHLMLAEVAAAAPAAADDPATQDLDLDELLSAEPAEHSGEAPPPIPVTQSSDTIETGPPDEMTLPFASEIDPDHLPEADEISELMENAQAEDPFAQEVDNAPNTSTDEPQSAPGPLTEEETPGSTYPAVTQESVPDDGAGASVSAVPESYDPEQHTPVESSSKTGLLFAAMMIVFIAGGAAAAYLSGVFDPLIASEETAVEKPEEKSEESPNAAAEVDAGAAVPEEEPDPLEEAASAWESERSTENAETYAKLLVNEERFDDARRVIARSEQSEALETIYNQTLTAQFANEQPVELDAEALEGAKTVQLRKRTLLIFEHDGKKARFIPDTGASISGYRASLAAYRLCQATLCGFSIPRVVPARITVDEWTKASASIEGSVKTSFTVVEGISYLNGAIQYEVDSKAFFPMYQTSLWRDWLDGDKSGLDMELSEALEPAKSVSKTVYDELLAESEGATTRDFAAQTASILAFDFLTNNFARFDKAKTDYDHGVVVDDSAFFSVDNLDTWRPRASTRVKGRFSWTRRFDRKSVESLRSLQKDTISPLLFPGASAAEKTALRVFWSQRDKLLTRVDSLVKSKGEEDVYFE